MPRKQRFAPPGYWLHLTQRGNKQQRIFTTDSDRHYFLQLLETHSEQRAVRIAAYTLMPTHFHLVAMGDRPDAISLFMMDVNGRYASYCHSLERQSGRFWHGRFYSCVLEDSYWDAALCYVELNALRARLVDTLDDFRWSSARTHLGLELAPPWLDLDHFHRRWKDPARWREALPTLNRRQVADLRLATRHDTAVGSDAFIAHLERTYDIQLRAKPLAKLRKRPITAGKGASGGEDVLGRSG